MQGSVKTLWTDSILPAVDNSLNSLDLDKVFYFDWIDELTAGLSELS